MNDYGPHDKNRVGGGKGGASRSHKGEFPTTPQNFCPFGPHDTSRIDAADGRKMPGALNWSSASNLPKLGGHMTSEQVQAHIRSTMRVEAAANKPWRSADQALK